MSPIYSIGITGTGPAALMAGSQCLLAGHAVTFFDHKKAPGRKFLVAGHGGFNLSHSEPLEQFLERYDGEEIRRLVSIFDNRQLEKWLNEIGIPTYAGSTGKIFPQKGIKPIEVLKAWTGWLEAHGAAFRFGSRMTDFNHRSVCIETQEKAEWLEFDALIFALGGSSWPKTGSDARWVELFAAKDIRINPLQASNAGMNCHFPGIPQELEGSVLKNIVASCGNSRKAGEITCTSYGFEGSPVYYLNRAYRKHPEIPLTIDFKPQWSEEKVVETLRMARNSSEGLKNMKLSKAAVSLLKNKLDKGAFLDPVRLAREVKNAAFAVDSLRPLEEAISTAGGVGWEELDEDLGLKRFPGIFLCGEMLDWDAPTGGYLLQGCFASGFAAGKGALKFLTGRSAED